MRFSHKIKIIKTKHTLVRCAASKCTVARAHRIRLCVCLSSHNSILTERNWQHQQLDDDNDNKNSKNHNLFAVWLHTRAVAITSIRKMSWWSTKLIRGDGRDFPQHTNGAPVFIVIFSSDSDYFICVGRSFITQFLLLYDSDYSESETEKKITNRRTRVPCTWCALGFPRVGKREKMINLGAFVQHRRSSSR